MSSDPGRWGIDTGYHDAMGTWRPAADEVVQAILAEMGAQGEDPYDDATVITLRTDHQLPPVPPGLLALEGGASISTDGTLPRDVPLGYHRLSPAAGGPDISLVVSPGRVPLPQSERTWGWAAQLYAARSTASWGMGDLADLRRLAAWSTADGGGITLINPLHASTPLAHQEPSPYFASSRCFANPLYLRVEEIPGAASLPDLERLAAAGRALNAERLIDRNQVWALKSEALEGLFASFDGAPSFDAFVGERGEALDGWATFCAIAEVHGLPFQDWPDGLDDRSSGAVAAFASAHADRVRYHKWLQWHLDGQLSAASEAGPMMQDLAIGVAAGGADAWIWRDTFATGMRVGAPPDEFNTLGQDWGLPPWDPWKLRSAGYQPFIETVRGGLRHAGGLRFDHVMGLFRLFWIPEGHGAADGTYVRYPHWDLLNILALEAHRAGAFVVGEDLGTVEDHVREELAARDVLSYRLFWFEEQRPSGWPRQALGAVTTHDLPTVAGVWTGSDLDAQRRLELNPNVEGTAAMRDKLASVAVDDSVAGAVDGAYRALGTAPCAVLTAALDDACGVEERPNMPGTTTEWPNWSIALPLPLEEIEQLPLASRIAAHLRTGS